MSKRYSELSLEELLSEQRLVNEELDALKAQQLKLNMARGKPGPEQLDMVSDILTVLSAPGDCIDGGVDARNYGELAGLQSARELFAGILNCRPEECIIGGSASLQLMYDAVSKAYTHGLNHSACPWHKLDKVKWLCPAPGYDRHFKITESFGFELITIPMTPAGPDMEFVEKWIKAPAVKGMWCVPKYSNPDGIIYSDETIRRIAAMKPAAPDFMLMWDNAYCVHEFEGDYVPFPDIISLCREAGNPDMVYEFASTSKITFPGAGISVMASSVDNIEYVKKLMGVQIISYDKINQLRHVRYLKNKEHTLELMKKHAAILAPKFECVFRHLSDEIAPLGIASWQHPKGGYFVSVYTSHGLARRTLELCRQAGVVMTGAGATYPYGKDPDDSNIRIAPSYPSVEELDKAMHIFCVCLRAAALEQLLAK